MTGSTEFWSGRRVLLTGHTGFKGTWLSLWLRMLGAEVWGYALPPETDPNLFDLSWSALDSDGFNHSLGDIRDPSTLEGVVRDCQPEIVFHLAAQSLVGRGYAEPLSTWSVNVMGTMQLLETLRLVSGPCVVLVITTDKVYENQEWCYGYRETDRLGGRDPYSASKAAAELAVDRWRSSFCGDQPHQVSNLSIATARAGNVIGGGDWAANRLIPDTVRSLAQKQTVEVRNASATRPWQHVLEPLGGYLTLARTMSSGLGETADTYNFGPSVQSSRSVSSLVEAVLEHWPGSWTGAPQGWAPYETTRLHLDSDKARFELGWTSRWDFDVTVERTIKWYHEHHLGADAASLCLEDISAYGLPS